MPRDRRGELVLAHAQYGDPQWSQPLANRLFPMRKEAVKQPPIIIDRCSHLLIAKLRQYLLCGHFGFSHFALCQMSEPKKLFFIGPALKNPVGV